MSVPSQDGKKLSNRKQSDKIRQNLGHGDILETNLFRKV